MSTESPALDVQPLVVPAAPGTAGPLPLVEELPASLRAWDAARRLADWPGLLFLDSADVDSPLSRFSFVTARPFRSVISRPEHPDPLAKVATILAQLSTEALPDLAPFQGGVAGLFSYDLNRRIERIPPPRCNEFGVPELAVGVYDWVLAFDHRHGRNWLIATGLPETDPKRRRHRAATRIAQVRAAIGGPVPAAHLREIGRPIAAADLSRQYPLAQHPGVTSNFDHAGYLAAISRGIEYVHAGDCFQVNLSQRLLTPSTESPMELYGRLRECNAAPFAGYFDLGDFVIASASPERFLKMSAGEVETRPIKGTRPRGATAAEDEARRRELLASAKDRAENVMIVDLLRNDLGRVCAYGSVRVEALCRLESFRYVHHLVSEVRGQLRPGLGPVDLLRAAFPGGSVTGAPKVRAMEIIAEMEPTARGPYCGCLGYMGFDGSMDTNLLIRTFTIGRGWVQFPVGGGIVAESTPQTEYEETLHKAEGLLRALRPCSRDAPAERSAGASRLHGVGSLFSKRRPILCFADRDYPWPFTPRGQTMFRSVPRAVFSMGLLACALSASAQEKLTKVEIGKRGKAATAFVHTPGAGTGTAFCVHSSGLFITNEHVVRGAQKQDITLVLNPALEAQRVLKARVVRVDQALDLALLRVEGTKDLPSLPLGSIKEVAELTEVVACGFPLGFALSADKKDYPAVSVNAGSVTALRYKDRELQHLQIDVAVTYGNSGGPVLDENGKVIGVVVSGIGGGGRGLNRAIPVNRLEGFLKKPDIAFTPPALTREALGKPLEFQAGLVSFVPMTSEPTLKLILQAGDEEPRTFPMKKQGQLFVAAATPVPRTETARVEVSVRLGMANVTGVTDDIVFKVAGKPMRLSGVRRIDFKEKPAVLLADGRTTVEGEFAGIGIVEIDLAGQKVKVDLAKSTQVTVQAAPEVASVLASVIAIVDGKEVARNESRIIVRDAIATTPADPATVKINPPTLADEKVVKRLPEVFSEVTVGGAGRYLVFHLPKLKKLAVFDVNEARVTKYIPLTEDDIAFAAGLDAVVIGFKKAGKLERWSLTTFELEKTAFPPFKENIASVIMGHGSNGPVVVNGQFLDLQTFNYLPIVDAKGNARPSISPDCIASADGTAFGAWNTQVSPASSTLFVLEGGVMKRYDGGELRHAIPGPDGRTVFTGQGIVSPTLQRVEADDASYGYCLPALRGDFFLSLSGADAGKGGGFNVYFGRVKRPIARLDRADHGLTFDGWDRERFGPWKRVYLVPEAKVIAVLPPSNDQIVLHKFDADAALEKSGEDYLLVTSRPPREVKAGTTLTYAIKTKSKQGEVTYKLDSGPKGMTVSADGVVTWAVPANTSAGDQDVILTVRDKAGQEVFHTFTLNVVK